MPLDLFILGNSFYKSIQLHRRDRCLKPLMIYLADGSARIKTIAIRRRGACWKRFKSIAGWNTTMDEHNYLVRRWMQFAAA